MTSVTLGRLATGYWLLARDKARLPERPCRSEFIPTLDLVGLKSDLHVVGSP